MSAPPKSKKPKPQVFERGDKLYIVAPVSPLEPGETEIEEFAFAEELRRMAPNENLMWLRGQYVEADNPNLNGQMWTAGELAIKKLTPMFMPVTVMHDPRTAVGLIADVALHTPDAQKVPRARIDSTLAVWKHRFPEVAEEAMENYKAGTLMQSMEALSPHYSCSECGQVFQKLADGAERENWCAHLRGEESAKAARILGNVTFTGTGLIYGTRGAQGAYSEAHLEINQEEIAEFHREAHSGKKHKLRKVRNVDQVEISRAEYDDLRASKDEIEGLKSDVATAEQAKAEAESQVEKVEAAKVEAETKLKDAEAKLEKAEEEKRKGELASERMKALGKGFTAKLGEFTRDRLAEQAGVLSDEEWDGRLKEVEELSGVKRDQDPEDGDGGDGDGDGDSGEAEFSKEELARAGVGSKNGGSGDEPTPEARRSVVSGLVK